MRNPYFQTSGTGKYRLAHELGKESLQFTFVFRNQYETGFPYGDDEVVGYFRDLFFVHPDVRVAGALGAIGMLYPMQDSCLQPAKRITTIGCEWYAQQVPEATTTELARRFSDFIAPTEQGRPPARTKMYSELVLRAIYVSEQIANIHSVCISLT